MTMAVLILEHLPALRRYARVLTPSVTDAEDLIQDTVERALVKQHLYQPETNLRAWLFTLMRNHAITAARKAKLRRTECIEAPGVIAALPPIPPAAENVIMAKLCARVLETLEPADRNILLMAADGLSQEEISAALLLEVGTVKSRISRARVLVRRMMDGGALKVLDLMMESTHERA